ncbi:MAG TPA: TlpA disulfide reductase family protein [Bryobacteraceae bacterium]|jgi:peroxiredoxin|nr:TlpA disulfide reductase family protein [Bryobacteraceae bacterium]
MGFSGKLSRRGAVQWLLLAAPALAAAIERGEPAPRFSAKTLDGEKYSSDSLKGKVVLIQFWATWCPYCKKDEPALETVTKEFEKAGLVVLAVDMGEPRRKVKKFVEASPRPWKVVLAEDTTLAAICEAKSYPMYVLIDREGTIAGTQHGAAGENALRRLLSRVGLESEN